MTVLRDRPRRPGGANCLTLGFRFLSDECPERRRPFNDGFIAELDTSNLDGRPGRRPISAPQQLRLRPRTATLISVNSRAASFTAAEAAGTVYDGAHAAPERRAGRSRPAPHALFLSVFDQGDDRIVDSAAFVDRLTFLATDARRLRPRRSRTTTRRLP